MPFKAWLGRAVVTLGIGAILGTMTGAAANAQTHGPPPAPPPDIAAALKLPDGPLEPIAGGPKSFLFLVLDQIKRSGPRVEVVLYEVFNPSVPVGRKQVVQALRWERIDCQAWTDQQLATQAFDEAGGLAIWTSVQPKEAIRKPSSIELAAEVVCMKAAPMAPPVNGHAAALEYGESQIARRWTQAPAPP